MVTPETLENKGLRIKYVVTGLISMEHFSNRCSYSRHLVGDNRDSTMPTNSTMPSALAVKSSMSI